MASRSGWKAFAAAFRAFAVNRETMRSRVQYFSRQYLRSPHLLLVLPAAGIVRSLSFFKSDKKDANATADLEISSAEAEVQRIVSKAETLYSSHEYDELVTFLHRHAHLQSDEILWRYARALSDKSKLSDDKAQKKQLIFEAFDVIKRALAINDKNFACHKWYAILLDKTAEYEGTKARISNAYVCKEHFLKASELNPKDATTLYTLGYWCFLFADMPWYQRKIASALFASPPTSTYQEALKYFHRAEEMDPNFYSKNLMMLGKTYNCMDNRKMAILYLTRAWEHPVNTPDDREAHKEAGELLSKLGIKPEEQKAKEGKLVM